MSSCAVTNPIEPPKIIINQARRLNSPRKSSTCPNIVLANPTTTKMTSYFLIISKKEPILVCGEFSALHCSWNDFVSSDVRVSVLHDLMEAHSKALKSDDSQRKPRGVTNTMKSKGRMSLWPMRQWLIAFHGKLFLNVNQTVSRCCLSGIRTFRWSVVIPENSKPSPKHIGLTFTNASMTCHMRCCQSGPSQSIRWPSASS